jgi:hypothetical protein
MYVPIRLDSQTTSDLNTRGGSSGEIAYDETLDKVVARTGGSWNALSGGGKVLQVVQTTDNTQASSTSGLNKLSTSITPSSTSSKILVMVMANFYSTADHAEGYLRRGGSNLFTGTGGTVNITVGGHYDNGSYGGNSNTPTGTSVINYLDSPNSTSAQTYDFRVIDDGADGNSVYFNQSASGKYAMTSSMILMEIGA